MAAKRTRTSSRVDPNKRWRPNQRSSKVCGYTFRKKHCRKTGAHYCEPRADKVVTFFARILRHTKGIWARKAFVLEPWQEYEIIRPLFGEVIWSPEVGAYVRRYRLAWIVLARKNGKSELVAGIVLYLLIGDDEQGAEVYGCAKDTKQAGKVGDVVNRMRELSPLLNGDDGRGRLRQNRATRRIYDERTASYFEIVTADALGELGHNPHGAYIDEVLSQPDDSMYVALRTAVGARHQPLMVLVTTETNDPHGFGAKEIDEAERIQANPSRAPHVFAYVRKLPNTNQELAALRKQFRGHPDLPVSTDPWDERNWKWPNPALGSFKLISSMREEALEARNDPAKEHAFRWLQLNQRQQATTRWLSLDRWDTGAKPTFDEDELYGLPCYAGLDLSATTDLTAWVLLFPPHDDDYWRVLWRFWVPEAVLPGLNDRLGGQVREWARRGLLRVTEGDWIDYRGSEETGISANDLADVPDMLAVHPQIREDAETFDIRLVGYDQREAASTAQMMVEHGIPCVPVYQGYSLSPGLKEIERLIKAGVLLHNGHPVARWNADSAEIRSDDEERIKLVKPKRFQAGARVDGIAALATAFRAMQLEKVEDEGEDFAVVAG